MKKILAATWLLLVAFGIIWALSAMYGAKSAIVGIAAVTTIIAVTCLTVCAVETLAK